MSLIGKEIPVCCPGVSFSEKSWLIGTSGGHLGVQLPPWNKTVAKIGWGRLWLFSAKSWKPARMKIPPTQLLNQVPCHPDIPAKRFCSQCAEVAYRCQSHIPKCYRKEVHGRMKTLFRYTSLVSPGIFEVWHIWNLCVLLDECCAFDVLLEF